MESDFKKWVQSLGYNGKEVTKAGETIGVGSSASKLRYRNEAPLSFTERLAMAAVAAGLPAWYPSTQAEISAVRQILASVKDAAPVLSASSTEDSSAHRIPAE